MSRREEGEAPGLWSTLARRAAGACLFAVAVAADARATGPPRGDLTLELPADGRVSVLVVAGPYARGIPGGRGQALALGDRPEGMPPTAPMALGGACVGARCSARTVVATGSGGVFDLRELLHPRPGHALGYAGFVVRARRACRAVLLVGASDGLRITLDGRPLLTREEARPSRADDDAVALDLPEGDHAIGLELHQRDLPVGAWQVRARLVGEDLVRSPDLAVVLPAVPPVAPRARVTLHRSLDAAGVEVAPALDVALPDGALAGATPRIHARLTRGPNVLFDVDAGAASPQGTTRVELPALPLDELGDGAHLTVQVADTIEKYTVAPSRTVAAAVGLAARALATPAPPALDDARATVALTDRRLRAFVAEGDTDLEAQDSEAAELSRIAAELLAGRDAVTTTHGASRRGLVARADGELSEAAVYVPPSFRAEGSRRYGLVVALHGLNGRPMQMLRWFFGKDDPHQNGAWEDRHMPSLPPTDVFVLAPTGYGNGMYRELGEVAVLDAVRWALARYPIDPARVAITGPSMGGIGAASIPLRHPWTFSAAAPLCGYHSVFVRRDMRGLALRPWERFLAEERSNAEWAPNGRGLPLYIVHGTQDLPEEHSGVLIDRYKKLRFSVRHEHPALGHNVWQPTYENPDTLRWLTSMRTALHPRSFTFRTARARWGQSAWVKVRALQRSDAWAEVRARAASRERAELTTHHVAELELLADELFDAEGPLQLTVDGTKLTLPAGTPRVVHATASGWALGPGPAPAWPPPKAGAVTGPLRDVFHEPLLFVYGTASPRDAAANEHVARAFAAVRAGITARYPVVSDAEFFERGEALANDRALFLVGSARSNRVVAALEAMRSMPLTLEGERVRLGANTYEGAELGAAYVYPNPARPDRYVAVVFGATPLGTLRALSLPDLLPDFVVYDTGVARARGQLVLGGASVRAAGFFERDWSLPPTVDDPLARR